MTKKRFTMPTNLDKGFSQLGKIDDNHTMPFRETTISLSSIETDPSNPRKLLITQDELLSGNLDVGILSDNKKEEYLQLANLAESIKAQGLIHPIIAYKHGDKYRVVAGERRTLASLMAGLAKIEARVFKDKPTLIDLKLVQWAENMNREDLTLKDRLLNIQQIGDAINKTGEPKKITTTLLADLIKISKAQASAYLSVMNGYADVRELIDDGVITSLDKALALNKIQNGHERNDAIQACINGSTLSELKALAPKVNHDLKKHQKKLKTTKNDKINLGSTNQPAILELIVNAVLTIPKFTAFSGDFKNVDWSNTKVANRVFKQFVKILETNWGSE